MPGTYHLRIGVEETLASNKKPIRIEMLMKYMLPQQQTAHQPDQESHGTHPFQGLKWVSLKSNEWMDNIPQLTKNSNPQAVEKQKEKCRKTTSMCENQMTYKWDDE